MPVLAFASPSEPAAPWRSAFEALSADIELRVWPELGEGREVDYLLAWNAPADAVRCMPGLKAVFSLGAGVDHLQQVVSVLGRVPVIRLKDEALTEGITEFVVYNVLGFHRQMPRYREQQTLRVWRELEQVRPGDRRVGILGLGVLGQDAARALIGLRFQVAGWSRSQKTLPGVRCLHAQQGLAELLTWSEILVCLLPLTTQTRGLLDEQAFGQMPMGSYLINAGRGGHVVESALLCALANGRLAGAALDVFAVEPLPGDSPLWDHPKIQVTPHIASITNPLTSARYILGQIAQIEAHGPGSLAPETLVDWHRGY